jgi:hypothetical protein
VTKFDRASSIFVAQQIIPIAIGADDLREAKALLAALS